MNAKYIVLITILILQGCAAGTSRLYKSEVPEGSLRLAEVLMLATTSDIEQNIYMSKPLKMAQKHEALTRDGSVVLGRVYCCGGKMDTVYMHYIYVPPDVAVEPGDIVEVKSGALQKNGVSTVNTVIRVVQHANDANGSCNWEPQDKYYGRILYCDWMPQEGWEKYQYGILPISKTWIKRNSHD